MKQFKNYLQDRGLSPATADRYTRNAGSFIKWYSGEDVINCQKKDVLDYLSHLKNRDLQTATRNNALIALRHYFDYLTDGNGMAGNPTALIKLRGVKKRHLHHTYTPEELAELVDKYYLLEVKRTGEKLKTGSGEYLHKRTYLAKMRNYTMLQFFVYQGITTKEALLLKVDDIQLHRATATIPKSGLRGNARTLPLNAVQTGALMQYLNEIRPQLETGETGDTLFLPIPKKDYRSEKRTEASFKGFLKQLKHIDRNFESFAQLRASVITQWIKTCGLRKAQYMAGHKSIVSTEEYLPNCIEDLAGDMTKFNPF
jgi:site-specific recombinase XerD